MEKSIANKSGLTRVPLKIGEMDVQWTRVPASSAIIVVAHGMSEDIAVPRNEAVQARLNLSGFDTLFCPLRTKFDRRNFGGILNIDEKARRLQEIQNFVSSSPDFSGKRIGAFGVGAVATACLLAASRMTNRISTLVAASSRPAMLRDEVRKITAPTLLVIPSGRDDLFLSVKEAQLFFTCPVLVQIVASDPHFTGEVYWTRLADLAERWFRNHLSRENAN